MTIRERIQAVLQRALERELPHHKDLRFELYPPRQKQFGDLASNIAIVAAKVAGENPMHLAERIAGHLGVPSGLIASLEIRKPGFINLKIAGRAYVDKIREIVAFPDDDGYGLVDVGGGKAVQVEFVSANPTGPLNVVSARAAAVGDALVRMLRRIGYDARSEFYVNDAGSQVELLGLSLEARFRQLLGEGGDIPEGGYPGEYLVPMAAEVQHLAQWADGVMSDRDDRVVGLRPEEDSDLAERFVAQRGGTAESEALDTWAGSYRQFTKSLSPAQRSLWAPLYVCRLSGSRTSYAQLREWLLLVDEYRAFLKKELPAPAPGARPGLPAAARIFLGAGAEDYRFDFAGFAVEEILAMQRASLQRFGNRPEGGLCFDSWVRESSLRDEVRKISDLLVRDGNFIVEKEGAVWLRGGGGGDEDEWVIRRSTGQPTYFLSDIAYHVDKRRRGFDKVIDIWGPDHHGHIGRMQTAVKIAGEVVPHVDISEGWLEILIVQQVNLIREGQRVQMSKRAGEYVTLDDVVAEVGADVARFFFLMRRCNSHLDFDLDLAKKTSDENPVYYVQYAHARISSILRFAAEQGWDRIPDPEADLGLLEAEEEMDLIKALADFDDLVKASALALEPHRIPIYLIDLAGRFHRFYHNHRVVTEDRAVSRARLYLCWATRAVLRSALSAIGISAPETM